MEQENGKNGLSTLEGVFTPTILTILGIVMYLWLGGRQRRSDRNCHHHSARPQQHVLSISRPKDLSNRVNPSGEFALQPFAEMAELLQSLSTDNRRLDDATAVCIQVRSLNIRRYARVAGLGLFV